MSIATSCLVALLAACAAAAPTDPSIAEFSDQAAMPQFSELPGIITLDEARRRKWDSPVIADLDGNGFMDMILTEHASQALIYWNEGGTFSGPDKLIGGDSHGVAVGDIDRDGLVEIIVSMGGGTGTNPRNPRAFKTNKDRSITSLGEYPDFERSRGRAAKLLDADNNGALDLALSAFPLETQPDGANLLYSNSGGTSFATERRLQQAKWLGYKTVITDFNSDGISDILFYGGANMVALRGTVGFSYEDVSETVFQNASSISDVSSISAFDYDRDGDTDYFLTRAEHQFEMERYFDPHDRTFAFFVRFEPFVLEDLRIEGDLVIENLQLAYPDFNIFLGSQKTALVLEGERHPGHNLKISTEQASGWPDALHKHGIHIGYLGDQTWRIAGHTRSASAGVIHNVLSQPVATDDEPLPAVLLENHDGVFLNSTSKLGISLNEQTTSAVAGDFNNDGWDDVFVVRYGNPARPNEQVLLINQSGSGFTAQEEHGLVSQERGATGGGAEAFDYDLDGDLDLIYSNERGLWHLFTNQVMATPETRAAIVKIGRSPGSNASPIGAQIKLTACGVEFNQIVGQTSSPFSQGVNAHLHFGLGDCSQRPLAEVTWPNGETEVELTWSVDGTVSYASTY